MTVNEPQPSALARHSPRVVVGAGHLGNIGTMKTASRLALVITVCALAWAATANCLAQSQTQTITLAVDLKHPISDVIAVTTNQIVVITGISGVPAAPIVVLQHASGVVAGTQTPGTFTGLTKLMVVAKFQRITNNALINVLKYWGAGAGLTEVPIPSSGIVTLTITTP